MAYVKAILHIDEEFLMEEAGTECFDTAFTQELGWVAPGGITLERWEKISNEEYQEEIA
jgi:hypothetical protein